MKEPKLFSWDEQAAIVKEWAETELSATQFIKTKGLEATPGQLYGWRARVTGKRGGVGKYAQEGQYPCKICDFVAQSRGQLGAHYRSQHPDHAGRARLQKRNRAQSLGAAIRAGQLRTEDDRRRILQEWKESGLTAHAYAKTAGVAPDTLRRWDQALSGNPKPKQNGTPEATAKIVCPHCGKDILAEYERMVMMLRAVQTLKV